MSAAIAKMIRSFRVRAMTDTDASELVRTYVEVVADLPAKSVCEAAVAFSRGKVDGQSKSFAPTTAELRTKAEELAEKADRLARLRLPPPEQEPLVLSEEEQARRKAHADAVLADMRAGIAARPNPLEDAAQKRLAASRERVARRQEEHRVRRYEDAGLDPYEHGGLAASPELRRVLAGGREDAGE